MRVDQARDHRSPTTIDHRGAAGFDRVGRDCLNHVALDEHVCIHDAILGLPIEDVHVGEQHAGRRLAALREKIHFIQVNVPLKRVMRCRRSKAGNPIF